MFSTDVSVAGCARVEGDEEDDDIDELENEEDIDGGNKQDFNTTMSHEVMVLVLFKHLHEITIKKNH